jgi:nitrite reductase/ring-hydroxylating ferredoxin subunit
VAEYVTILRASQLQPGQATWVDVKGREIALFNVDGTYYAIDNECSHLGGPLGEGRLDGAVVTCPWHGSRFDVRTGQVVSAPARDPVRAYPVQVEGDDVQVALES